MASRCTFFFLTHYTTNPVTLWQIDTSLFNELTEYHEILISQEIQRNSLGVVSILQGNRPTRANQFRSIKPHLGTSHGQAREAYRSMDTPRVTCEPGILLLPDHGRKWYVSPLLYDEAGVRHSATGKGAEPMKMLLFYIIIFAADAVFRATRRKP